MAQATATRPSALDASPINKPIPKSPQNIKPKNICIHHTSQAHSNWNTSHNHDTPQSSSSAYFTESSDSDFDSHDLKLTPIANTPQTDSDVSSQHMRHNADLSQIKKLSVDTSILLEEKDTEEESEEEYNGGSILIHEDLELDDKQREIEEYEAYIKKHNKSKKRKKKSKKKKKRKSEKQHHMSPIFVDQSSSQDLWDIHEMQARALKQARVEEEKEKKRRKNKVKKRKLKKRRSQKLLKMSPKERKKFRETENLSKNGFKIVVNRRYELEDGRIGVCKFRGRTVFGKTGQDWIGIMVERGRGEHNGTVDGVKYFLCKEGKGIMVRPRQIVQDLGSSKKEPIYSPVSNATKVYDFKF